MVTGWQKNLLILCILISTAAFFPTRADTNEQLDRLKIGLVLAGGGARGGAHIGVLKVLEENRIPVDYIAGTSFGAIVGALYASGYSAEALDETLRNLDWAELLSDSAPRKHRSMRRKQDDQDASINFEVGYKNGEFLLPNGLVRGNQLRLTLAQLMAKSNSITHFDALPIPFRAIAADLLTGDEVILEDGDLASAVLASMSVPGLFPPFERGDQLLVDGGIVNNLPIDVARDMGADVVIVVDISAAPATREDLNSFAKVLKQMITLLTLKSRRAQLETLSQNDILIKPDTTSVSLTDFTKTASTVPQGAAAASDKLEALLIYQLDEQAWHHHLLARKMEAPAHKIDFISINNKSRLSDGFIEKNIRLQEGELLDQNQLANDLTKIYGSGDFESIDYQIIQKNGQTGIEITAKNRAVGNDYLRFGVSLEDDFSGTSNYSLSAIYTKRGLNDLGAEWRNKLTLGNNLRLETEFYQPLDDQQKLFAFIGGAVLRTELGLVDDDGDEATDIRIDAALAQMGVGYTFSNWGSLSAGIQRTGGNFTLLSSVPDFSGIPIARGDQFDIQETSFFTQFELDTLDNANFPRSGTRITARYSDNQTFLGGDSTVNSIALGIVHAETWGIHTLVGWFHAGGAYGGEETPSDNFSLGGFRNLSGLQKEEISGRYMAIVGTEYRRLINKDGVTQMFGVPLYAGLTLEAGNVWNQSSDIKVDNLRLGGSLFLGADTAFGPLYLGAGYTSGGNTSAFLFLGAQF